MRLSGKQREKLQLALIDAFPDIASLEQMLVFGLNKNLRAIAGEGSLEVVVFKVIQKAESQGWVDQLIDAACKQNPGNQGLKAIAQELLKGSTAQPEPPTQQQNNRRGLVVPIFVAVIGAIGTITVVWIIKPQQQTTPPSPLPSNEPSPKTLENQPLPVAPKQPISPLNSGSVVSPVPQGQWYYFKKPCKAGMYIVIADSVGQDTVAAKAKIDSLRRRFSSQLRFKLWYTSAPDGSNDDQLAIVVGHGLNKPEADSLAEQVRSVGLAAPNDTYPYKLTRDASCTDITGVEP